MIKTLNYTLEIHHLPNGQTMLTTPVYQAVYNEKGELVDAGVKGHSDFAIPLPSHIQVEGRPKKSVGKEGIKSILRDTESQKPVNARVTVDIVDSEKPISEDHDLLFSRLKDVLHEYAPEDGQYMLNLKFIPDDDKEHELVEPSDAELATLLALVNYMLHT